jgi:O-antigen/teichoic acid export membrane protein
MTESSAAQPIYRRIGRNSAQLMGATIASALLSMLALALTARTLSAREFGALVLLQSSTLMLRALMSPSTQQPVIKLGSAAKTQGNTAELGRILWLGLVLDLAASLLALGVSLLLIYWFGAALGLPQGQLQSAHIFAGSLLFIGYSSANGIFRLFNRFGLLSLIQTIAAAGLFVASGALFLADAPLEAFVWTWAIYLAANSQLQLWAALYLARRERVPLRFGRGLFSGPDSRTFLHYCWSTCAVSSADTLRTNGDTLLVGAVVSVEAAGLYNVAKQLAGVLRKLTAVYDSVVFPEIAMLSAKRDWEGAKRLKARMIRAGLAVAAAAAAGAALLGPLLIDLLFGARFAAAYLPFVILTAAAGAQLAGHTPGMYVQIYRGPGRLLMLHVLAVAAFALAALPLTFALGMIGTAAAQLVFGTALLVLCERALRRTFDASAWSRA